MAAFSDVSAPPASNKGTNLKWLSQQRSWTSILVYIYIIHNCTWLYAYFTRYLYSCFSLYVFLNTPTIHPIIYRNWLVQLHRKAPRPDGKLNAGRVLFQDTTFSASTLVCCKIFNKKGMGVDSDQWKVLFFWGWCFIEYKEILWIHLSGSKEIWQVGLKTNTFYVYHEGFSLVQILTLFGTCRKKVDGGQVRVMANHLVNPTSESL